MNYNLKVLKEVKRKSEIGFFFRTKMQNINSSVRTKNAKHKLIRSSLQKSGLAHLQAQPGD